MKSPRKLVAIVRVRVVLELESQFPVLDVLVDVEVDVAAAAVGLTETSSVSRFSNRHAYSRAGAPYQYTPNFTYLAYL